jgi:hypothetical protein
MAPRPFTPGNPRKRARRCRGGPMQQCPPVFYSRRPSLRLHWVPPSPRRSSGNQGGGAGVLRLRASRLDMTWPNFIRYSAKGEASGCSARPYKTCFKTTEFNGVGPGLQWDAAKQTSLSPVSSTARGPALAFGSPLRNSRSGRFLGGRRRLSPANHALYATSRRFRRTFCMYFMPSSYSSAVFRCIQHQRCVYRKFGEFRRYAA